MDIWDAVILIGAAYLAVIALVRLMAYYRTRELEKLQAEVAQARAEKAIQEKKAKRREQRKAA